jgi:hypothetical protein
VGTSPDSSTVPLPVPDGGRSPGRPTGGLIAFLRTHPILCLAILTPGIPEYLSTSSSLLTIATSPVFFVLQIAINVGQYTAGALLVREAVLRWNKGWATVFLLGGAYGVTEEGLGDNTLFNSSHGADGILGSFGHFAGVNWVWATAVLAFHVIYSIGLPILLLGLALPSTRGRSLLARRGIAVAFASLIATTSVEMVLVWGEDRFWLGWPLLIGSLLVIGLLVYLAHRVPAKAWRPVTARPWLQPWQAGLVGFGFFPIAFVLEYGFTSSPVPPAVIIAVELVAFGLLLEFLRRGIGRAGNEYLLVNLAFGFVLWQGVFGFLLTLGFPYTLPLIAVAVVFFLRLRRAYSSPVANVRGPTLPPGVLGSAGEASPPDASDAAGVT